MERRQGKVIIHASGGTAGKGSNTYKLTLPSAWVKEMGINELNREVELYFDGNTITVAKRISKLLQEKNISQYRLEQESGIQHGSMQCIMNGRNKTVTLSTVILLAKGFNMPLTEFLDDDIFRSEELEVER